MKYFYSLISSLICFTFFGQSIKDEIKPINTVEQANTFIENHSELKSEIWKVNPEIEKDVAFTIFKNKTKGDIFSDQNNIYKVIDSKKTNALRASYIFLDGNQLTLQKINELRKIILEKHKSGIPFAKLANEYTMDSSKDGDLGWFTEGMMVKEFEEAIKNHQQNDIFTIDLDKEKWYYVSLKTFSNRKVEELTILKIKS